MNKFMTCMYVHYYTVVNAPKSWLKYMLFCIIKRRKPNPILMSKVVTITKIYKSLKRPEHISKDINTSIDKSIKLHYKCN